MKTKEYILTNTTQYLNSQGATNSSLRQIAAYLEMSDGNLRYHFRTKEELLLTLFHQMWEELELLNSDNDSLAADPIRNVQEQYRAFFFTMYRYKFIFLEGNLLMQQYLSFKKAITRLRENRKAFMQDLITKVQAERREDCSYSDSADYHRLLLDQMLILSDNWLRYVDVDTSASLDNLIDHYLTICLLPLASLLPEAEKMKLLGREVLSHQHPA